MSEDYHADPGDNIYFFAHDGYKQAVVHHITYGLISGGARYHYYENGKKHWVEHENVFAIVRDTQRIKD